MKVLNRRNVLVLRRADLAFVDEVLGDDVGRGRPPTYRSGTKLRVLLFGWSFRERFMTRIATLASGLFGRIVCGLRRGAPSHDVLTDFFHVLERRIEDVFARLVVLLERTGVLGRVRAIDTTFLPAYRNDGEARYTWDSLRNELARGYGLLVVTDRDTHAVVAARVRPTTPVSAAATVEVAEETRSRVGLDVLLGDSEFDLLRLHAWALEHEVLVVVLRNVRNRKRRRGPKYRVQDSIDVGTWFLDRLYRRRVAVEQLFKGLKADLGLADVRHRGIDAVRAHAFLILIWRNLQVLDAWAYRGGKGVRNTTN